MIINKVAILTAFNETLSHITNCMSKALIDIGIEVLNVKPRINAGKYFIDLEAIHELKEFAPDCVFFMGVNGFFRTKNNSHLFNDLKIPYYIFNFDYTTRLKTYIEELDQTYLAGVYTWDRKYIQTYENWGIENVKFLPLATAPDYFDPPQGKRDTINISFVGNIISNEIISTHQLSLPEELIIKAEHIISKKNKDSSLNIFDEKLHSHSLPKENITDFYRYINYRTLTYYRKRNIYALARNHNINVFGPDTWQEIKKENIKINNPIDYKKDLQSIFHQTKVNLNFSVAQLATSLNQRIFDCFGNGNFILTDYKEDLDYLFAEDNIKIPFFITPKELCEKTDYYLNNDPEREKITSHIQEVILKKHTWKNRMQSVLNDILHN